MTRYSRPVLFPDVEESANMRMIETGDGLRFALNARATLEADSELVRQHFDGDNSAKAHIARFVDLAHPTLASPGQNLIMAQRCAGLDTDRCHCAYDVSELRFASRQGIAAAVIREQRFHFTSEA